MSGPDTHGPACVPATAVEPCGILRLCGPREPGTEATDDSVAVERAVTIEIAGAAAVMLLCTPTDVEALAVGFALSEGLIDDMDDVLSVRSAPGRPDVIGLAVAEPDRAARGRNLIVSSSCGLCGVRNIEGMFVEIPPVRASTSVDPRLLWRVVEDLAARQEAFRATGGTHAAGLFGAGGEFLAFAEDLGRHNALDKAIGHALRAGRLADAAGVALSGRVSFEMVAKCARARLEILVAVSAPSSLAVTAARRWGVMLVGFVRPGRANVYHGAERIGAVREADHAV